LKNNFSYQTDDTHIFDYDLSLVTSKLDYGNTKIGGYALHDFGYRFNKSPSLAFYLKLKNVFDLTYQELYGYGTAGRTITLGAQYKY